jgi:hypothetical protein
MFYVYLCVCVYFNFYVINLGVHYVTVIMEIVTRIIINIAKGF